MPAAVQADSMPLHRSALVTKPSLSTVDFMLLLVTVVTARIALGVGPAPVGGCTLPLYGLPCRHRSTMWAAAVASGLSGLYTLMLKLPSSTCCSPAVVAS